jgi:hypothetical protein
MASTEFGFYPVRYDVKLAKFEITTLDDFNERVESVISDSRVHADWIYAPLCEVKSLGVPGTRNLPYTSRVFALPKTHRLTHTSEDPKRLSFLIWVFGFLVGIRMSDQKAGFLDAATLRPGMSNDVVWCGRSLQLALTKADDFFECNTRQPAVELAIRAVIHSYLLAHLPTLLDFERFLYLYTAVDAAFAAHNHLHCKTAKVVSHKKRIAYLCESLGLPTPWWADCNTPYVAQRRNETIHEGLFFGEPWGFMTFGCTQESEMKHRMILLELQKLMCRIIMALLDVRDETYLKSAVDDRQRHGINLE